MDNVEIVKQGYQYFSEANIEAVLALFHPEIEWDACRGLPYITGESLFTGPNAIAQNVFAKLPEHFDGFHINVLDLFGSGDKVVMVGHYKGVYKETGKEFKANATHVWTMKDGKATHYFQAVDTAEIIKP
jgi:hypothetical protein